MYRPAVDCTTRARTGLWRVHSETAVSTIVVESPSHTVGEPYEMGMGEGIGSARGRPQAGRTSRDREPVIQRLSKREWEAWGGDETEERKRTRNGEKLARVSFEKDEGLSFSCGATKKKQNVKEV